MYRIVNQDNITLPRPYPKVSRELSTATKRGSVTVGGFTLRKDVDFIPNTGLQEQLCSSDCNLVFICGQATSGKAQPYDAKVLTPNGFVEMGSLQVGDEISGVAAPFQQVVGTFEQGELDVCRFTLESGEVVESSLDHLWFSGVSIISNMTGRERNALLEVRTTQQLIDALNRRGAKTIGAKVGNVFLPVSGPMGGYGDMHAIKSYEMIGKKPCRCILVSNPDRLYITDDYVVTHNTYSMFLKALCGIDKQGFTARLISVRLQDSKKGSSIFRDGVAVCGNFANCEYNSSDYPTFAWPHWNSNLQLIHSNFNADNPAEWEQFQDYAKKVQASLIMIDEATEIKQYKMFTYWFSRNRDASGMPPQMVLSFNPSHDHWTTEMLRDAGYLGEDWYLRKDMIGKVRYFYNKGNKPSEIIWGNTREEVADRAGLKDKPEDLAAGIDRLTYVKSFTVFTGNASDNRELVFATKGQSVSNLHAVGETQRQIIGEAYFGPIEKEESAVTRQMIHNLWENPLSDDDNMYATMDISSGASGNDKCPMAIWRGLQIIALCFFSGEPRDMADWITRHLEQYQVPIEHFAFDATGHGYWVQGLTDGVAVTANKRSIQEYDSNGNPVQLEQYFNVRSQLLGKMRVMFERGDISCALDKDTFIPYGKHGELRKFIDVLFDEINIFNAQTRNGRIYYRSKGEYIDKFKHSPDLMDTLVLRAIFELDGRPKKQPLPEFGDDAYDELFTNRDIGWGVQRHYNNYNFQQHRQI